MTNEEPRLLAARRGFSLRYRGKTILSAIDPIAQAERAAAAAPVFKQTLYVVPSPLLGYGLDLLLARATEDSGVLCVEADAGLCSIMKPLEHERIRYLHTASAAEACSFVRREFGSRKFRRIVVVRLSGGYSIEQTAYDAIELALRADIGTLWSNAMTLVRLGRRYALNAFRNLARIPSAEKLRASCFGTCPVLVLGAGPSLDDTLDGLRPLFQATRSTERAFRIVCVDTALPAVLARGIEPDLVVALEAQHWNLRDFIGARGMHCALAMDLSALPASASVLSGRLFLFSIPWTPLRFFDRLEAAGLAPPRFSPLGSVGLTALEIALRSTSGPVVFSGLDFAYGIGAYHARGTPSRIARLSQTTRFQPIIDPVPAFRTGTLWASGKDERRVRTDPALRSYRDLFDREFCRSSRVFDAGSSGLPLKSTRVSTETAHAILNEASASEETVASLPDDAASRLQCARFVAEELQKLDSLLDVLRGAAVDFDKELLLDDCDYLWAHFPECAGADDRPRSTDLSFLKRVRAEIDPFRKALRLALADLQRPIEEN